MTEQYKNKLRPLRFFLSNASEGQLEIYHAPDGWKEAGHSFSRSIKYHGVIRKYALDKLGFTKEAKRYLEKIESEQGFEAGITLIVWEFDYSKYSYFEAFRGNILLVDKGSDRLKFTVPIVDSSFESKLLNRDDVDVIVTKRSEEEEYKSLDGKTILGYANEGNLITLPSRIDFLSSLMTADRDLAYITVGGDPIIPLLLKGDSDDDNVQGNTNDYKQVTGAFYVNNTGNSSILEMEGSIGMTIAINPQFTVKEKIKVQLFIINSSDIIVSTINIPVTLTLTATGFLSETYSVVGNIDISETIPADHYVQIGVMEEGFTGSIRKGVVLDFSVRTQSATIPQINLQSMMAHELLARIGQVTTSENSPLYSEFFGRTDSEPRKYTYNGEGSFLTLTNGGLIRGFGMTNREGFNEPISPLSASLNDTFDALNTNYPIGMGIETIDGSKVFRIEELKYFYDTRIAITIDNATDVKREYNKDLIYNEIEIGYTKFESDEQKDGLFDYNTKSAWTNAIESIKNDENIISKYSASNASINTARQITREDNPTTDSKYDDINYLIDVVENQAGNAVANSDAEAGLSDWAVTTGVTTELLIGNNKFVLQYRGVGTQTNMQQQIAAIETPVFSFSYAVLSSEQLTLTPTAQITARLNSGVFKSLNANGDWIDGEIAFSVTTIKGVLESQFQSMNKFEIAANDILEDINYLRVSFDTDFLIDQPGTNELIIDDVFVSDSAKFKARTTEGFDYINGIVNSNDSYNINLSPARSLKRRGYVLRAALEKKLNTSYVFSNSEKISNLVSKRSDESFEVAESTDVLVNNLEEPLWTTEKVSFEAAITPAQRRAMNESFGDGKPKFLGLVAFRENTSSAYEYGWIEDMNTGGLDGRAKFEIRPISQYVQVAEDTFAIDDDGATFIDDDNEKFII